MPLSERISRSFKGSNSNPCIASMTRMEMLMRTIAMKKWPKKASRRRSVPVIAAVGVVEEGRGR